MLTTSPSLDRTKQKKCQSVWRQPVWYQSGRRQAVWCQCVCGVNLYDVNLCDVNLCDVKLCDVNLCDVNLCDVKLCDVNLCDVNLCGVNLCDVKLCDVNLCDFNLCDVNLCDVNLCDVNLCDVNLCDVKLCDVNLCDVKLCDDVSVRVCDVNLCGVCLCDVNLCDVNLCDYNLCDVNLCDVNLFDVKLCDVNLCDVNLWDVKLCDVSVRVCDVNLCGVCLCDVNLRNANLCAQLPQTQFTHSKAPNPHARKTPAQNFRISYWHLYPERNLHTARRQTRMPGRHQHKIFASPIGTATPNAIYTQQGAKPECQQDIHTNFCTSYWHSYPERNLHTASRPTRMPGRHPHKIFASPIGTATPNAIYTQQGAKPACQEDIHTKFSQLLLAQLPRTQFTHSKAPNPNASRTSTQNFRSSYWHSYPERNLHTARRQTRMPARHPHKLFAPPIGTATPNAIYTQQAAQPACQEDIHAKFSQLLLAQLPRTQCTHSKAQNPHARKTTTQNFRISYWHSYPERNLHTARRQTRMPARHPHKLLHLLLAQLPRTQFTHSKPPNPHARKTSTQNFRISYWHSYPERNLHTARRKTRMPGRHPHKIFAAPIGTATPNAIYTQQGAKPACQQDINAKFSQLLLAQLPPERNIHTARRQTRMPARHPHKLVAPPIGTATPNAIYTQQGAKPECQQDIHTNFCTSYWHSYPERNLHTASRPTRMPGRQPHKIFASPIGTATPSAIYTQQGAKPECQQDINAKFSQLLLAQLPRTQFTHSKPPNKHARKTTAQNFRVSYCDSYPERNLHTARRQTPTQGRHPHKIFAPPIVTATPSAIYTQQGA